MKHPTREEIAFFADNGVVCLRQFLNYSWLNLLQTGFLKNIDHPSPYACFYTSSDAPGLFRDDYCNWTRINEFRQVIFESNLAPTAGLLLNANEIRFFHEHIFYKKRGTLKKTPWHQDLPYFCVDGDQGLSFWIPLTDIDVSNQIEFIAGSHKWGRLFRPQKFNGIDTYNVPSSLYDELPNLDAQEYQQLKLAWTMDVGDVIAFDFRTLHGNSESPQANLKERQTIALRFIGENMRYSARPGEKSPPFSGINLKPGQPMIHDLFPLLWSRPHI